MLRNAGAYLPDYIKITPYKDVTFKVIFGRISILLSLSAVHLWNFVKTRLQIPLLQAVVQRPA